MSLDDLPPLREALQAHGLLARKALGQHFLLDLNITRKIARLAALGTDDVVIEVGPGPGGLTRALLETGAKVIAIEKDRRFEPLLIELAGRAPGRLELVFADALDADEAALTGGAQACVVSNLPYNVGTPLLVKWLTGPFRPTAMTLMFQKEVAQRIVAPARSDAYGRLAVLAQATSRSAIVLDVPARAFTPPPRVDSAVVRLTPGSDAPEAPLLAALQEVSAAAFGQRRKMLRTSLRALGGEALCAAAAIDPSDRAEVVPVDGFLRLAEARRSAG
jgi:16S rRNA (adenine1518-N6/adenine1519-N6)-dimethyltransferase